MTFQNLTILFNHNLTQIKREINSLDLAKLKADHLAEDDGHLAKILANKGIRL